MRAPSSTPLTPNRRRCSHALLSTMFKVGDTETQRGRWNRENWHRETWQNGTRSNSTIEQRLQSPAVSSCSKSFGRRAHGMPTAAGRRQQQQQRERRRRPTGARTSSDNFNDVRFDNGGRGYTASDDCCEVCFVAPRGGFALVPCGHARFCEACAMRVSVMEGDVRCVALKLPWSCVFFPR